MKWHHPLWVLILLAAGALALRWWWDNRLESSQDGPILVAAQRYGLEPALVKAVVWQESRFNPNARGKVGEIGLMQIQEEAAREWAEAERVPSFEHEHCFDPATNTPVPGI